MQSPHGRPIVRRAVMTPEPLDGAEVPQTSSLQKLTQLKTRLQKELLVAEKEKLALLQEEPVIPLSLVDEYKDQKRRGKQPGAQAAAGSQDKQAKATAQVKINAKQRDIDLLFESQEKERRGLELHSQRLRNIIDLRQQSSIRHEARSEEEISRLKGELDKSTTAQFYAKSTMPALHELNAQIQSRISQLQSTIEQRAEVEKMNLVRQYRVKMHELKKDLAEEQQSNYTGAQEWIDKNNILKEELDEASQTLDKITSSNVKLALGNKELKVRFKQQDAERNAIVKQVTAIRKENRRLQDQVRKLEEESAQLAKKAKDKENASADGLSKTHGSSHYDTQFSDLRSSNRGAVRSAEYEAKYLEMINRIKRQLEQERRTLKQVRSSHIELLQERTELEVFLKQCIHDVRREISKNSTVHPVSVHSTPVSALEEYHVEDRARLLDLLLSKERVITMLYTKTFPFKLPQEALPVHTDGSPTTSVLNSTAELDMDTLWDKWKAWAKQSI